MQQSMQAWDYSGKRGRNFHRNGALAPDARTLAYVSFQRDTIRDWAIAHGLPWPFSQHQQVQTRLLHVETENEVANLPPWPNQSQITVTATVFFSPDGKLYAERIDGGIRIWDIPPRKSLVWYLGGVALLALLLGIAARRFTRGGLVHQVTPKVH